MTVNIITIKFKDGSSIYIDDVSDYAINNNVIKINKNGYNQFFNFDDVRYIGRTFDLEPEIYNSMKITYANSMTSTMRREIRLDLQSVKPSR